MLRTMILTSTLKIVKTKWKTTQPTRSLSSIMTPLSCKLPSIHPNWSWIIQSSLSWSRPRTCTSLRMASTPTRPEPKLMSRLDSQSTAIPHPQASVEFVSRVDALMAARLPAAIPSIAIRASMDWVLIRSKPKTLLALTALPGWIKTK